MSEIYEVMRKYGQMVMNQGYPVKNTMFMLKTSEGIYATRDGADFSDLKEDDIHLLGIKELPFKKPDVNAVLYSLTPNCKKCIEEGRSIPAALDEMAQIIGPAAWVVDGTRDNEDRSKHLTKAFKRSNAAMVFLGFDKKKKPTGYSVTLGRNLYEAVLGMTVLEKCAEIDRLADTLGGVKAIPKFQSKRIHKAYLKSYAKAEIKVRNAEVK